MIRVIKFEANWCGPCKVLDHQLDRCREDLDLVRVDIEEHPGIAQLYRIRSVPTLVILKDAIEVQRMQGVPTAKVIDACVRSHLV